MSLKHVDTGARKAIRGIAFLCASLYLVIWFGALLGLRILAIIFFWMNVPLMYLWPSRDYNSSFFTAFVLICGTALYAGVGAVLTFGTFRLFVWLNDEKWDHKG
jgi:hypothetical protein